MIYPDMIETALALFAAHLFADFLLQIRWIIDNKRRTGAFLMHVAIVTAMSIFLLGACSVTAYLAVAIIAISHAAIDCAKLWQSEKLWVRQYRRGKLTLFLVDQALHGLTIVLTAWYLSDVWSEGWWATFPAMWQARFLSVLCLGAGFVLATRAGGFMIELFMLGFIPSESTSIDDSVNETPQVKSEKEPNAESDGGLIDGGKWIGLLERSLIFVLIMAQEFQAIGFLIAAKSILRFQYARERSHSETVIIGTLASFGWAIVVSSVTYELIELLNSKVVGAGPWFLH